MSKKVIKMNESALHSLIKESIGRVISEMDEGKYSNNKPFFHGGVGDVKPGQKAIKHANPDKDEDALEKHNARVDKHLPGIMSPDKLEARKEQIRSSKRGGMPRENFKDTLEGKLKNKKQEYKQVSESALNRIVKESVNEVLTELDWKTYANAARKASDRAEWGKLDRAEKFADAATKEFNKKYGVKSDEPEWMTPNRYAAKIGFDGSRRPGAGMSFRQHVSDNLHTTPDSRFLNYHEKNHCSRGTDRWKSYDSPVEGGNWENTKGQRATPHNMDWPDDFDTFKYIEDMDVKDRAYKGDEELKNYYRDKYDYQNGKGWELKH